jgi:hypothetical protein
LHQPLIETLEKKRRGNAVNDVQLERSLQFIGKMCFAKHYELLSGPNFDGVMAVEFLMQTEKWTRAGCDIRILHARNIIRAGRGSDALQIIAKSVRVQHEWRYKAMRLARF